MVVSEQPTPPHLSPTSWSNPVYTYNALILLTIIVSIILLWFESLRVREAVTRMCRQICEQSAMQLLDQTVTLVSLSVKRSASGRFHVHRIYQFEVSSNGADRFAAYVAMRGRIVDTIRIDSEEGMSTIYPAPADTIH